MNDGDEEKDEDKDEDAKSAENQSDPPENGEHEHDETKCTCGGQAVYERIYALSHKVDVTPDPRRYEIFQDLLEYCYQHMHFLIMQEQLSERICEQLVAVDDLEQNDPLWRRYQLLKYLYAPSFLAGEKLAHRGS